MTHHFAFGYSRVFSLLKGMVCLTALLSKRSRNFNYPTFQIIISSVSISYLKPSCLSHREGSVKERTFHEKENLSLEAATPETLKQIMHIIHCNVKPRYQQSRLSLQFQIFPLLIQEGLCKV